MDSNTPSIVCFGEVLWDLLPSGKIAGGAPMNVAVHARQLGIPAQVISNIGDDALGNELSAFLRHKGVDITLLQTVTAYPTGTVNVTLDYNGSPTYEIVKPVAWDFIHTDKQNTDAARNADAFVYGSLAARHEISRNTLLELLEVASLKVFDVNLRSPYYSDSLVIELLGKADIVKMNDEELQMIGKWLAIDDHEENIAMRIKSHFDLHQLIVTRGSDGAWLFNEDGMMSHSASSVVVQDTIGCGDSFLAAFLSKFLQDESPEHCLEFAAYTGAYVATQKGGTPEFSERHILDLMNKA